MSEIGYKCRRVRDSREQSSMGSSPRPAEEAGGAGGGQDGGTTLAFDLATAYLDGDGEVDQTDARGLLRAHFYTPWTTGIEVFVLLSPRRCRNAQGEK